MKSCWNVFDIVRYSLSCVRFINFSFAFAISTFWNFGITDRSATPWMAWWSDRSEPRPESQVCPKIKTVPKTNLSRKFDSLPSNRQPLGPCFCWPDVLIFLFLACCEKWDYMFEMLFAFVIWCFKAIFYDLHFWCYGAFVCFL